MRARRTDSNLSEIVKTLRKLGIRVHVTNGDWDLTVKFGDYVRLVEVKDGTTRYGRKGLNKRQETLLLQPYLIRSIADAEACAASMKRYDAFICEGVRRELAEAK